MWFILSFYRTRINILKRPNRLLNSSLTTPQSKQELSLTLEVLGQSLFAGLSFFIFGIYFFDYDNGSLSEIRHPSFIIFSWYTSITRSQFEGEVWFCLTIIWASVYLHFFHQLRWRIIRPIIISIKRLCIGASVHIRNISMPLKTSIDRFQHTLT